MMKHGFKRIGRIIDVGERAAWFRLVFFARRNIKGGGGKEYGWIPARGSFLFAEPGELRLPFSAFPIIAQ